MTAHVGGLSFTKVIRMAQWTVNPSSNTNQLSDLREVHKSVPRNGSQLSYKVLSIVSSTWSELRALLTRVLLIINMEIQAGGW